MRAEEKTRDHVERTMQERPEACPSLGCQNGELVIGPDRLFYYVDGEPVCCIRLRKISSVSRGRDQVTIKPMNPVDTYYTDEPWKISVFVSALEKSIAECKRKAKEADERRKSVFRRNVSSFMARAREAMKQGRWKLAKDTIKQLADAIGEDAPGAAMLRGEYLCARGRWREALELAHALGMEESGWAREAARRDDSTRRILLNLLLMGGLTIIGLATAFTLRAMGYMP